MKSLTSIAYKILTALMIVMLALTAMPVTPAYAAAAELNPWVNLYSGSPGLNTGTVAVGNLTVSAGTNRLLVVAVCAEFSGAQPTTIDVTLGGTALTPIASTIGTTAQEHCWLGRLLDSQIPAGSSALSVAYNIGGAFTTLTGLHVSWTSYTGIDQTTPINDSNANYNGGATVQFGATTVDYVQSGLTLYVAANGGTPATMTAPAGFTQRVGVTTSGHSSYAASITTAPHAANGTYAANTTVTFTGTTSTRSAVAVASLRPYLIPTTTTVTSSLNPSLVGQSVTFTATVTGAGGTPTGNVTFYDAANTLGTVALNASGEANFSTSALAAGSHNITAVYASDGTYAGSTSAILAQVVNLAPTITSANTITFTLGQNNTFTATATGFPVPTWSAVAGLPAAVTFNTGTHVLSGIPAAGTVGSYPVTFTATNTVGTDTQNFTLVIQKGPQTITFAQPPTPAGFGTTYTINPVSNNGAGQPTGLPITVVASGACTNAGNVISYNALGTCTVTTSQPGDASYNLATPVTRTVAVQPAATTTTITSSVNPSVLGQNVIFTVRVYVAGTVPPVPVTSGTVTIQSCEWTLFWCAGGTTQVWGTYTLVGGIVTINKADLPVARYGGNIVPNRITVTYNAGGNYAGSNTTLDQTVNTANTAVSLTSSINPSSFNQPVIFTATVTVQAPAVGVVSGGTVTLYEGATVLGTGTVNASGVVTFTISNLAMGSHDLTAHFVGTDDFGTSTSPVLTQIVRRPSDTALDSAPNPSVYGSAVTFTATVTGAAATPTGTVSFYDDIPAPNTLLGTGTLAGGIATFNTNALIVGDHNITAVYNGDLFYVSSTSPIVVQTVTVATLTVTADPKTITYGDADPLFTFQYSGFLLGDTAADITLPPTCDAPTVHVNAGTYTDIIECSGAVADNYTFAYVNGTLTVNPKALTITAVNQGKTYGFILALNGTEFTTSGLIFSDTVTSVTLTCPQAANPNAVNGTYPIVPSAAVGSGLGNYAITYVNGTLTIAGNLLVITANNQVKTYGQAITIPGTEFTYFIPNGLPGGGVLLPGESITSVTMASFGTPANAPVGTYPIVPSNVVGTNLGNYLIVYKDGQLDVNQAALTFNPDSQIKTYGDTFTAYTGTFTGLFAFDNTVTPVYDSLGAPATALVAGSPYPINVTFYDPDDRLRNYIVTVDPLPAATLTILPRTLTVTPTNRSKVYGVALALADFSGTITGIQNNENITATYDSPLGDPATAAVGTYNITATLADPDVMLGNYALVNNVGILTVTQRDLIVTSDSQTKIYGDVFIPTAFTGSITGLQNGDNITLAFDSAGSPATALFGVYPINITLVDQVPAKLGNYRVIPNVGTLAVTQRTLVITPINQTKIYGDTFTAFTGTVTGIQNSDAITPVYSSPGAINTATVAGSPYLITVTLNDPDGKLNNYNYTLNTGTLTVTLRDLTVTSDPQSKEYGTWFFAFTGGFGAGNIQNGDNITANFASAGSLPSAAVGSYPITITLNDPTGKLGNYTVIRNEGLLTVGSSMLTITADNKTITYGDPEPAFTFTYSGFASGDTPAVLTTRPTCTVTGPHTNAGTYVNEIVCSGGVDDAYTFTYVPATLTITRRDLLVTSVDKVKTYGALFTAFTGSVTGAQFGETITATYDSLGAPLTAGVGSYPITITLNPPAATLTNYNVIPSIGMLTVGARDLTVTPADKIKVYGDVAVLTGSINGIQNGDPITATYTSAGTAANATVAGSPYTITATLNAPVGVLANYSITYAVGSLTVNPRPLVVTPFNQTKVFGTLFTGYTGTVTGIMAFDNITVTYFSPGAIETAPVGSYDIDATLVDPDGKRPNYAVTLNTGTLTVRVNVLTVTANNQTKVYGDLDPTFTFTYSGFMPGDGPGVLDTQPSCQVSVPHNNVGPFPITCSGGIDNNYGFSYVPGTLTVTSRTLVVIPANRSKLYGDALTALDFTGTITGIQGGDIITANYASTGAVATAGIGPYTITATLNDPGLRLGNYTVTYLTGTLTVNQRPLTVTPNPISKIYGNVLTALDFTGTIVGIQNSEAITATYASPLGAPATATVAGSPYTITATLNAPAGVLANYTVTSNTGALTVTRRDLVVQPADKTKVFGTLFTAFTGSLVGIQNNDNITATYDSLGAPVTAAVGPYPITATLVDPTNRLPNYNVSIGAATLTVTLANQTITITTNAPPNAANGNSFTVAATASSGLAVTYSTSTPGVCTNVGATFTINAPNGTCVVRYNQAGNANFSPAPERTENVAAVPNSQTITVTVPSPTVATMGASFDVAATASSGLIVSITVDGVCTRVDHGDGTATITVVSSNGTCTVHYDQAGDSSYARAPQINAIITIDSEHPTVTANQVPSPAQPDPTNVSPINFIVEFSELVTGFTDTDVTIAGTAGATTAVVTEIAPNDGTTYNVAISGMTADGTVIVSIPAGAAIDIAGNDSFASSSTDNSVMYFDDKGPTVQVINTAPDTGDGALTESEKVTVKITHFKVTFNQDVYNPAGDSDTDDVTNPNNYMLIRDLGDTAGFQTVSCSAGAIIPADTKIAIGTVIYDSATSTATFTFNGDLPLSNGTYRLYVCGTTSIVDPLNPALGLVGIPGQPNSDFIRNFTVDVPEGGGGGNNRGDRGPSISRAALPFTGFAPNKVTLLPVQPADKAYKPLDEMRLEIPTLGINFPIVGVSLARNKWNLTWLRDSVGYLEGSAYPTFSGNTVLTAHVIDANNNLGPFSDIKGMQYGDKIYIHAYGKIYIYQVQENRKLAPTNIATVFRHEEYNWVTLVTCEDYDAEAGLYTYRRMVRAVLISVVPVE